METKTVEIPLNKTRLYKSLLGVIAFLSLGMLKERHQKFSVENI